MQAPTGKAGASRAGSRVNSAKTRSRTDSSIPLQMLRYCAAMGITRSGSEFACGCGAPFSLEEATKC